MKQIIRITGLAGLFFLQSCSLQPAAWTPQEKPALEGAYAENSLLTNTEWIDLEGFAGPEDIAVGSDGYLYTSVHPIGNFNDGKVIKISPDGKITTFCNTGSWLAGLHFDANNNLIGCDSQRGLIQMNKDGEITVLANKDENGKAILIPNDVDIAKDGRIYFSSTSSRHQFSVKNARRIILEAKPDGGLYRYNPETKKVETLIDSSYFGNGVALSAAEDFVLMVDLTKYRVVRYWLKGEKKGTTDLFISNLPGLPNGISRRQDGSFWLGFTTRRSDALDKLQSKPRLKQIVFALPLWMQPKQEKFGMIMHLSAKGEVIKTYYDPTGEAVSEAASIEEHEGYLYLGGDLIDHNGKLKLPD
jgi:sugar lactone lactonase YvrE